jgi:hypothetical protein
MSLLNDVVRPPYCSASPEAQFAPYEIPAAKKGANSNGMETTFAIFLDILCREAKLFIFELKRHLPFCARMRFMWK